MHRLFENKNEVQIYDYVDIHVRMLERMYSKRLNGYSAIGYKAKGETNIPDLSNIINIIFDQRNFLPAYKEDITNAVDEIIIASPYVSKKHVENLKYLQSTLSRNVNVTVVTRSFQELNGKNRAVIEKTIGFLKAAGINVVCEPNLFQKFAVIDKRIVWYGSINLLCFGKTEESIMRLESPYIASELLECTKK
ncbi:phospholipase D-like domain-containing protein [Desulfitibacter alkalitolerans]|uniref:phospholipase D-like domain-containing protein n=1 Tax=Desulfitibacter alkalitolerans TaxID=264641 RepID=UPI0004831573|nr:phospholipase D-like domain-containing protein [Desulfitibacter alkalitolerans]